MALRGRPVGQERGVWAKWWCTLIKHGHRGGDKRRGALFSRDQPLQRTTLCATNWITPHPGITPAFTRRCGNFSTYTWCLLYYQVL